MAWTNHFLDSLPSADIEALRPHLAEVRLEKDELLSELGQEVGHVHLPIDCILSVVTVMKNGSQVESRTIGRESGYGLLHALGSRMSYERMTVQVEGRAWKLPLPALTARAAESPALVRCIVRHAQATVIQSALATACNTLHTAEARLCRWLLLTQDRLGGPVVPLTQEHLSIMLGVQRTTVTALAQALQDRGFIAYSRGKIRILDRPAIERCACECYAAMQGGIERLLAVD
jgi:CRP-like cAMP-binding protein